MDWYYISSTFNLLFQVGINQPVFVLLEYSISRNRLLFLAYACCNGEYKMGERIIPFKILKSILVQVLILTIFFRKIPFQCIPYLTYGTSKSLDHEIHLKEAVKKYLQKKFASSYILKISNIFTKMIRTK